MSTSFLVMLFSALSFTSLSAQDSCKADHTIFLSNFKFTPDYLTILPGETVAFINANGTHDVRGDTSSITGLSFNNPADFSLPVKTAPLEGVCLGVVKFDKPGKYDFDCSVGFNANIGMTGSILVDATTIYDLFQTAAIPNVFQSSYAFSSFFRSELDSSAPYTIFLPNEEAVDQIIDSLQVGQFAVLRLSDLPQALKYHMVDGIYMAKDLKDSLNLTSRLPGQTLSITEENGVFYVDNAAIISTDYTAYNGVVHVIDKTLAPSGFPLASVWDVVERNEDLAFLESAILETGYKKNLRQQSELSRDSEAPGPFTIFAPTDKAIEVFAQSLGMTSEELLKSSLIDDIVKQHIVESRYLSDTLFDGQSITNYAQFGLQIEVDTSGIYVEGSKIVVSDLLAYNGVVHIIDVIIPIDIIPQVGTCGTWTLEMYDEGGDGWEEATLYLEVDGNIIAQETLPAGNFASLNFGVDSGSIVSAYMVSSRYNREESYRVFDNNKQIVAASGQNGVAVNSVGLLACAPEPACGFLEIQMVDKIGQGWGAGYLEVYTNDVLYLQIPFYVGERQSTFIPVNEGDVFDFFYIERGFDTEMNGYRIIGPDGRVLANQDFDNRIPENVEDITVCEKNNASTTVPNSYFQVYPNPASKELMVQSSSEIYRVEIVNMFGQKMHEAPYSSAGIDISSLAEGSYITRVYTAMGLQYQKISIAR